MQPSASRPSRRLRLPRHRRGNARFPTRARRPIPGALAPLLLFPDERTVFVRHREREKFMNPPAPGIQPTAGVHGYWRLPQTARGRDACAPCISGEGRASSGIENLGAGGRKASPAVIVSGCAPKRGRRRGAAEQVAGFGDRPQTAVPQPSRCVEVMADQGFQSKRAGGAGGMCQGLACLRGGGHRLVMTRTPGRPWDPLEFARPTPGSRFPALARAARRRLARPVTNTAQGMPR